MTRYIPHCIHCNDNNLIIQCACGCGQIIFKRDKRYRTIQFIKGHHLRGNRNPSWIGGRIKDKYGYWLIKDWTHPHHNASGYVREHRVIWEQYYNACLLPGIHMDHSNQIRDDNRIENLRPMTSSKHMQRHMTKDMSDRVCSNCKSNKTYIKPNNRPEWFKDGNDGYLCRRCHRQINKLWYN